MKLPVKSASFSTDNSRTSRLSIFSVFLTIKTLSQNISITLLQISLKLHEHRNRYWRKKLPWTILEEQFPVPRYTAASKIGNSVISLLWQLWCRCNSDHNKLSPLSNTTVVLIFPNLCLRRRRLYSNLGGMDPEKLYRATLRAQCHSKFPIFFSFNERKVMWTKVAQLFQVAIHSHLGHRKQQRKKKIVV